MDIQRGVRKIPRSHYDYLDEHLESFFKAVGLNWDTYGRGIIVVHGDKCSGYRYLWEEAGIPFPHGVALYLLTHCYPFDLEVRQTAWGWVSPQQWVLDNYQRFREHLPPVNN